MTKGVNLSHWWAHQNNKFGEDHLTAYYTVQDFKAIREMGFNHVRFPIDPLPLGFDPVSGSLNPARVKLLKTHLRSLRDSGLFVVMDLHLEGDDKWKMRTDDRHFRRYIAFWRAMGIALAAVSPDDLAIELVSEPDVNKPEKWWEWQGIMVRELRTAWPQTTFVVGADGWNRHDWLAAAKPYSDTNLVYNFHYYSPFVFTHQHTGWGISAMLKVSNLDYPPDRENVERVKTRIQDPDVRFMLSEYLREGWGKEKLASDLAPVASWARRHGALLTCNEFGANGWATKESSKARWTRNVREILEGHGIGWSYWDYASPFGITRSPGRLGRVSPAMLRALGLPASRFTRGPGN